MIVKCRFLYKLLNNHMMQKMCLHDVPISFQSFIIYTNYNRKADYVHNADYYNETFTIKFTKCFLKIQIDQSFGISDTWTLNYFKF